ncbi:heterokaryon incompatibility protein-domain-containing protein [Hypoxylon trugodes]|uniref:heterokaryon incompatibility protein-domain-containing protein n=1 Tax=Hypoxylon trugodes TaxID=326681 RepID=UPI00218F213F|nr:heterokaryon incompatibility protein-domain-containing protein [Hypoxylon trugodes]KAI1388287.1 heterokaryon incompatibility protein-domain-containing protein [Hypoxylon trugodes]
MIRLIDTTTLKFKRVDNEIRAHGRYAILSHVWLGKEHEVSFKELKLLSSTKKGAIKVREFCRVAREVYGLKYAWVDTRCINHDDLRETQTAINSMFRWYKKAAVCIVHLFEHEDARSFPEARKDLPPESWFKRAWTLQELLAPKKVHFYNKNWHFIGSKVDYASEISTITSIPEEAITNKKELGTYSVAQRMSWVAGRKTTYGEDIAYCLLGIFDIIDLPKEYGLGNGDRPPADEAFRLLQMKIIDKYDDLSIFAWYDPKLKETEKTYDLLARSPELFAECGDFVKISPCVQQMEIKKNKLQVTGQPHLCLVKATSTNEVEPWEGDTWYNDTLTVPWGDGPHRCVLLVSSLCGNLIGIHLEEVSHHVFRKCASPMLQLDMYRTGYVGLDGYEIILDSVSTSV